ncbi:site-specific DNA-methyltransferase [Halobacillus litoralis]|uniref:DNA methylase N-4/N-6 domain-containing protein n=1 Tax=Halobacillus litoralis TaxID=45668 RepID=A0A410MC99_9BACI|nr:DNA methyltransferase [Halobacillus litoralis]QAS52320.1 hypothetical protein HLI_08810 [Halobacillus litoralis]
MNLEVKQDFINKLEDMFRFNQSNLNFGLYRVLNKKREIIYDFIHYDLFNIIEEAVGLDINKSEERQSFIYSHLLEFFSRYYDEGDFISQRRFKDGTYYIPYEGGETKYHWANYDQFYVKSSEDFSDYQFSTPRGEVLFKLLDVEIEENNNKGEDKEFHLIETPQIENPTIINDKLIVYFQYVNVKKAKQKKINKDILMKLEDIIINDSNFSEFHNLLHKPTKSALSRLEIELSTYTTKNTQDYFIHKNLKGFLELELENYIKNEIINLNDLDKDSFSATVSMVKAMSVVAKKLIEFLSQIEEFQKKLWLKKKFVVSTDYIITLDKIDDSFYPEIIKNKMQINQWRKDFAIDEILNNNPVDVDFLKNHRTLSIDTKFYDEVFKDKLIASFENIEEQIPGLLINSDNYQALNLLSKLYKNKVDTIYIDPPYNTDASQILYKNNYRHSSWMSLMADRINLGRKLLKRSGIQTTAIDDFELKELYSLLEMEFGRPNFAGIISVLSNPSGRPREGGIAQSHEYLLTYKNSEESKIGEFDRNEKQLKRYNKKDEKGPYEQRNLRRDGSNSDKEDGIKQWYPFFVDENTLEWRIPKLYWDDEIGEWRTHEQPNVHEQVIWPINDDNIEKNWRWSWEHVNRDRDEIYVLRQKSGLQMYYKFRPRSKGISPSSFWKETKYSAVEYGTKHLQKIIPRSVFNYPKSIHAVMDTLQITGMKNHDSVVLDYFAGSGTTGEAALQLMRKDNDNTVRRMILIEMGKYFESETKKRIAKSMYSEEWYKGKPKDRKGLSYAFKYQLFESYEDALNNIQFSNETIPTGQYKNKIEYDYLINYIFEYETKDSMTYLNIKYLSNPFKYQMNISERGEMTVRNIDLIETFNYLLGISLIKSYETKEFAITTTQDNLGKIVVSLEDGNDYKYKIIEGKIEDDIRVLVIWRTLDEDLILSDAVLKKVIQEYKIQLNNYNRIYINGDSSLKSIYQTEVFQIESTMKKEMFNMEGNI